MAAPFKYHESNLPDVFPSDQAAKERDPTREEIANETGLFYSQNIQNDPYGTNPDLGFLYRGSSPDSVTQRHGWLTTDPLASTRELSAFGVDQSGFTPEQHSSGEPFAPTGGVSMNSFDQSGFTPEQYIPNDSFASTGGMSMNSFDQSGFTPEQYIPNDSFASTGGVSMNSFDQSGFTPEQYISSDPVVSTGGMDSFNQSALAQPSFASDSFTLMGGFDQNGFAQYPSVLNDSFAKGTNATASFEGEIMQNGALQEYAGYKTAQSSDWAIDDERNKMIFNNYLSQSLEKLPNRKQQAVDLELTSQQFKDLDNAAKAFMLDAKHPERLWGVGSTGAYSRKKGIELAGGPRDIIYGCAKSLLEDNGWGARLFGNCNSEIATRILKWPHNKGEIMGKVGFLLHRVIRDHRERERIADKKRLQEAVWGQPTTKQDAAKRKKKSKRKMIEE